MEFLSDNWPLFFVLGGLGLGLAVSVIEVVRKTAWGQANAGALDVLAEVLGQLKKLSPQIEKEILDRLSARERTADPAVVDAWKAARERRDPKPLPPYRIADGPKS